MRDLGDDQEEKKCDNEKAGAHNDLYLEEAFTGLHAGEVPCNRRPSRGYCVRATTQKEEKAREFQGKNRIRVGTYVSR